MWNIQKSSPITRCCANVSMFHFWYSDGCSGFIISAYGIRMERYHYQSGTTKLLLIALSEALFLKVSVITRMRLRVRSEWCMESNIFEQTSTMLARAQLRVMGRAKSHGDHLWEKHNHLFRCTPGYAKLRKKRRIMPIICQFYERCSGKRIYRWSQSALTRLPPEN